MLADLHCHSSAWSFQKLRNSKNDVIPRNSEWLLKYLTENEIIQKILPDIFLAVNPYTPAKAVEMICFKNAYDFTLTHFK